MKWKAANVKEKVNEGVDEVLKVIKAGKGEIDEEDEPIGGKTLVILALGCAAGSGFLAAKVEKCKDNCTTPTTRLVLACRILLMFLLQWSLEVRLHLIHVQSLSSLPKLPSKVF